MGSIWGSSSVLNTRDGVGEVSSKASFLCIILSVLIASVA